MQLPKGGNITVHGRLVSGRARVSLQRAGLSAAVPVSPPGGRRGRRCSSRGATAQGPRPVAQKRRGRVVDEHSVTTTTTTTNNNNHNNHQPTTTTTNNNQQQQQPQQPTTTITTTTNQQQQPQQPPSPFHYIPRRCKTAT